MCLLLGTHIDPAVSGDRQPDISVSQTRLRVDVKSLTDIRPPRNYRNLSSLTRSAYYILREFSKLGCTPSIQTFTGKDNEYKNLICSFGRPDDERVVVGAHYDVYGDYPGADDNASGVAGLLELGRLFNELKPALRRRIDLVAYSLEEPPFFRTRHMGSYVHAKSLAGAKVKVRAMICLESIGYFSDEPYSQQFPAFFFRWLYPDKGNFIIVVGKWGQGGFVKEVKQYMAKVAAIPVHSITAPVFLPGIDFSNHRSYWKFGYDAAMVTDSAFYRNPHYHEPTDTIETLNFHKMAEVVKGLYWAILHL